MNRLVRNRKTSVYVGNAIAGAGNTCISAAKAFVQARSSRRGTVLSKRDWSHLFYLMTWMLLGAPVTISMPFNDPGYEEQKTKGPIFHSLSF